MFSETSTQFWPHGIVKRLEGLLSLHGGKGSKPRRSTASSNSSGLSYKFGVITGTFCSKQTIYYALQLSLCNPSQLPLIRGKGRHRKIMLLSCPSSNQTLVCILFSLPQPILILRAFPRGMVESSHARQEGGNKHRNTDHVSFSFSPSGSVIIAHFLPWPHSPPLNPPKPYFILYS